MPKRKHSSVPIVPTAAAALPRNEPAKGKKDGPKAVLWLQATLRVNDNLILNRAASLGTGGMDVCVVWRHGRKVPTPSASFMAAACRSLHDELRKLGSGLTVLHALSDDDESAAVAVAAHAAVLGVRSVVVDACETVGLAVASLLEAALARLDTATLVRVEALTDDTLFPHAVAVSSLQPSRSEASDVKSLRWASFLKAAAQLSAPPPAAAPRRLPPSLTPPLVAAESLPLPVDSEWWGVPTLRGWLRISGVPISEVGALQLAEAAGTRACRNGRPGFSKAHLGERAGAGDDADGKAAPRPSYLSPFLRWGVLSARQAEAAGVRRRDLLWRDL